MKDERTGGRGLDPSVVRGLTQPRISRRQALHHGAIGLGAVGASWLLAACGVGGTHSSTKASGFDWSAWWKKQHKSGDMVFANWPYYIDTHKGQHPTLQMFQRQTGIKVDYKPVIQENESFYAKISPSLQAGQSIGYDLFVETGQNPLFADLVRNDWLIPLDHSYLTNFEQNASPLVKDPYWDPGNRYSIAWQSGITGIGYNPKLTGREINSVLDLWDPAFKGHVGMLADPQDLPSFGLLALGMDPGSSSHSDWQRAADKLQQQRDAGIVRQYYDQSYIQALENGDTWISMAWGGDIFQANLLGHKELKFVVPKQGAMFWTDSMVIPKQAEHPVDAIMWMDYVYRPEVAALLSDWIGGVSPVPSAKKIVASKMHDPTTANSPLVFMSTDMQDLMRDYYIFKNEGERHQWLNLFQPVYQS